MLIIVPVRNLVLFPGTVVPVAINRERSLAAAQEAVRAERKVGFLLQQDPDLQSPTGVTSTKSARSRASCAM
jgi:ATP-dependent Lon protease